MLNYIYENELEVRDYECDIQGIVNNSVYQNYLEHTRHKFLSAAGLDFARLHTENIDPVVYRIEIDYKLSLKSGDIFISKLNWERKGNLKIIFNQDIYRKSDNKLIIKAKVIAVVLQNGKPVLPDVFLEAFKEFSRQ
jgi:acyl-CoA thioester hydrolase